MLDEGNLMVDDGNLVLDDGNLMFDDGSEFTPGFDRKRLLDNPRTPPAVGLKLPCDREAPRLIDGRPCEPPAAAHCRSLLRFQ